MIQTFISYFFKNGYLLIIAVCLYLSSYIFTTSRFSSAPQNIKSNIEEDLRKGENTFRHFADDSVLIGNIIMQNDDPVTPSDYANSNIGLYVYICNNIGTFNITYWNNNKVLPAENDLLKADGYYFLKHASGNFEYIKRTVLFHERQVITVAMIPVYWDYFFQNSYLKPTFPAVDGLEKQYKIAIDKTDIVINGMDGKKLFGLQKKDKVTAEGIGLLSLSFRVVSILFFFIFLNGYAYEVSESKIYWEGGKIAD